MEIGTIHWRVVADTDDIDRAQDDMERFRKAANDADASTKKLDKDLQDAGKRGKQSTKDIKQGMDVVEKATKRAAQAVVAFFSFQAAKTATQAIIRTTKEFSSSISELSAITGAAGDDLAYLSDQAKDIGRTTTLSASQAAQAFKLIASAKPDLLESGAALNAVTREAVTLAEAARIELPAAASALGTSLNQFRAGADQANRFINVLAAGAKFGASAIADTTLALKNSGAAANAAGVSFETTNAAIQALAAGGIVAAEAGTSLRNIILILEKEQETRFKPSVVGLTTAIQNLAAENMNLTELTEKFGRENVVAAQTIITQKDSLAQLEQQLTGTQTATEQAQVNFNNLEGDMLAAKSATEGLQIALGERLTPALRGGLAATKDFALAVTSFVESDEFEVWLSAAATAAEILATVLAVRLVVALGSTAAKFATTAAAAGGLRSVLALLGGPAGVTLLAVAAIYKLVSSMGELEWSGRRAREEVEKLTAAELELAIVQQQRTIQSIQATINRLKSSTRGYEAQNAVLEAHKDRLAEATQALADLEKQLVKTEEVEFEEMLAEMTEDTEWYTRALKRQEQAQRRTTDGVEDNETATRRNSVAVQQAGQEAAKLIAGMRTELSLREMGDRQRAISEALIRAGTEATGEQVVEIIRLTNALYDQDAAIRATAEAEKKAAEEAEKLRDAFADFFTDLLTNGEDAFDALAKSFERMLIRMVAQWGASKIMDFLGVPGMPSAPSLAGGPGGAVVKTLGQKFLPGIFGSAGGGAAASAGASAAASAAGAGLTGAGSLTTLAPGLASTATPGIGVLAPSSAAGGGALGGISAAAKGAAGAIKGALGAIPGWGWALAGAAALATVFAKKKTPSHNAGLLLSDLPGVPANRKFQVEPFESGISPVGFMRRTSKAEAEQVIELFRTVDSTITNIARAAGLNFKLTGGGIWGLDETGHGRGNFFGSAGEKGKPGMPLADQLDLYTSRLIAKIPLDGPAKQYVLSGEGGEDQIARLREVLGSTEVDGSHRTGLSFVPFDGYVAEVHRGEGILTAQQNREFQSGGSQNMDNVEAKLDQVIRTLRDSTVAAAQQREDMKQLGRRQVEELARMAARRNSVVI